MLLVQFLSFYVFDSGILLLRKIPTIFSEGLYRQILDPEK